MRPDQFALLLILLSTPQPHAGPALLGTWQSQDPVVTTTATSLPPGSSSLQEAAIAPARVRLTFSPGTCHTHHPTMDATYPCSIKASSDRSSFVVEHFDPERHRQVRRVFVVDGNRMWTRAGDSGGTEVFTRVH